MLNRQTIEIIIRNWISEWNNKNIDGVMELFHEDIIFDHWTSSIIKGKKQLKRMLKSWFEKDKQFIFDIEDIFLDETAQKLSLRWSLTWPSPEKKHAGYIETRRGIDIIHFKDDKICNKLTYSKTKTEIADNDLI